MRYVTYTVQRDRHTLFIVETEQADGSHSFEIADNRNSIPFGIAVIYDPALPHPNELKVYTPASWSDGLLAEDWPCVVAMVAEAADRASALALKHESGRSASATVVPAPTINT